MAEDPPRTRSGRPLEDVTVEALRAGTVAPSDLAIHAETLLRQARIAEERGYRQLARNYRRAAELTRIPDAMLAGIYDRLRPRRSSYVELLTLAQEMAALHDAPETGAYIRAAAEAYRDEGLLRSDGAGS
ncbi:diol dehydratase small subunit [Rubellimicrobium roseum]|nr:diol dehydratase small subunit [Rubellimicrobium roseum]